MSLFRSPYAADDECGIEQPNCEYECSHYCDRPREHHGDHSVTFTWSSAEPAPDPRLGGVR